MVGGGRLKVARIDKGKRRAVVLSIDEKIGIQRQNGVARMNFRHSDNAGVGQRHGRVPIFSHQLAQFADILVNAERHAKRPILNELKHRVLRFWETGEQMHRFGKHWFANQERRVELLDALGHPMMAPFGAVEKSSDRSVSTIAQAIASKAGEMAGIRSQIGNA